jgi:hypothetical protein
MGNHGFCRRCTSRVLGYFLTFRKIYRIFTKGKPYRFLLKRPIILITNLLNFQFERPMLKKHLNRPCSQKSSVILFGYSLLITLAFSSFAQAQTSFTNVNISFNEYAFPTTTTVMTGTQSYNLINDSTAAKLNSNNNDLNDFSLSFATSGPGPLSTSGTPKLEWQSTTTGRFTSSRGFNGAVSSNNPGTRVSTTTTLLFDSHVTVTDFSAIIDSLNTAGVGWETSKLGFLKPDGSFFSPEPTISTYLATSAAGAVNGSPSTGWFVLDSTGTTTGVGTGTTVSGANGSNDNNFVFNYAKAGLPAGTQIGGIVWTTNLDDVRGTTNGATNFTASWSEFTFSGSINTTASIPEPSTLALLCPLVLGFCSKFRRRAA